MTLFILFRMHLNPLVFQKIHVLVKIIYLHIFIQCFKNKIKTSLISYVLSILKIKITPKITTSIDLKNKKHLVFCVYFFKFSTVS